MIMAHQSGHTGVLNTLALERLGITPDTPVPEGGMMEVADGKVTGYMEETAFLNCQSRVPMPAPEDLMGAYLRAQDGYARRGVTTVQEGMMIPAMEPLYRQLCAAGLLKLDVVGYLDITQADGMRTRCPNTSDSTAAVLRWEATKLFWTAHLRHAPRGCGSRTAVQRKIIAVIRV